MAHIEYKKDGYIVLEFTSSETWQVPKGVKKVDITVVGAGDKGSNGCDDSGAYHEYAGDGGDGGDGGGVQTYFKHVLSGTSIPIVVAPKNTGSTDRRSSFDGVNSSDRTISNGGRGAYYMYYYVDDGDDNHVVSSISSKAGTIGTPCPLTGNYYGGGGGGGGAYYKETYWLPEHKHLNPGSNGIHGGHGGESPSNKYDWGRDADPNTGGGGGGGLGQHVRDGGASDPDGFSGGDGGSGIVIVRYRIDTGALFFSNNF